MVMNSWRFDPFVTKLVSKTFFKASFVSFIYHSKTVHNILIPILDVIHMPYINVLSNIIHIVHMFHVFHIV